MSAEIKNEMPPPSTNGVKVKAESTEPSNPAFDSIPDVIKAFGASPTLPMIPHLLPPPSPN
jgi:hypothetical protein